MFAAHDFARRSHGRRAEYGIGGVIGAAHGRRRWPAHRRVGNARFMACMGLVRFHRRG
ncbi:hypothetical protein QK435_16950 [Pseudomonas aeruginosa]|nr:hypothetical protein [Pseudomonas aeruginosa]MDI4015025.1 hypothetical protein [Pseudomonas aeruginosa]MDI4027955.1 hypothetical protein [Pseudomonas aeruginosa]